MNPQIVIKNKHVNIIPNYNDSEYELSDDDTLHLYHVIVSEDKLKIAFTVVWQDPSLNDIEFKVVKKEHLYLDGHDRTEEYPPALFNGRISSDPTIVQDLFKKNLEPYGLVLHDVINHNFVFYETINYSFTDSEREQELYSLINQACIKAKYKIKK